MKDMNNDRRYMLVQLRKKIYDEPAKGGGYPRVDLIATAYDPGTSADYICSKLDQTLRLYDEYGAVLDKPYGEIDQDGRWVPDDTKIVHLPPMCW